MKLYQVNVSLTSRQGRQQIVWAGSGEDLVDVIERIIRERVELPAHEDIRAWHFREIDEHMMKWLSRYSNRNAWTQPEVYNYIIS